MICYTLSVHGALPCSVASGVGRVAAFIGVSVLGALVIARLKNGEPFDGLLAGLFAAAVAAAALHWLESWLAHAIAYQLLAEMRIALYQRSAEHTSELQSLMRISYAVFCLTKQQ